LEVQELSQELILKALTRLGLSEIEARTYMYLEKNGPKNINSLMEVLESSKEEILNALTGLQKRNVVRVSVRYCEKFLAEPFEKAINLLIQLEKEQNKTLKESKEKLLSNWKTIIE
jgi:DNA-binding Lrp family transcriptional regulator